MAQNGFGLFYSTAQNTTSNLDIAASAGATVTVLANNDFYKANASSNSQVFLVPNPSTVKGKVFTFEKVDGTFNIVTLNDGSNVTTLNTQDEAVQIISDGASYLVMNRRIPSGWTTFTPAFLGSVSNPTKANANVVDAGFYRRIGDSIEVTYQLYHTSATGALSGSGAYRFGMPSGVVAGTSLGPSDVNGFFPLGNSVLRYGSGTYDGYVAYVGATFVSMLVSDGSAAPDVVGSAFGNVDGDAVVSYSINYKIPISGWKG